jgi:hypothetical protein
MNAKAKTAKKLQLKKVTLRDLQEVNGGIWNNIIKKVAYPAEYLSIAAC